MQKRIEHLNYGRIIPKKAIENILLLICKMNIVTSTVFQTLMLFKYKEREYWTEHISTVRYVDQLRMIVLENILWHKKYDRTPPS